MVSALPWWETILRCFSPIARIKLVCSARKSVETPPIFMRQQEQRLIQDRCETEQELRLELVRFSRWLSRLGFAPGTSGSLSVRLGSQRLLMTPTGVPKGLLRASDPVIIDLHGKLLAGSRSVASEISLHLAIYEQRPDVGAVVHAPSPIARAFACSGQGLDNMLREEAVMTVGAVPLAPFATTGPAEVAASIRPLPPAQGCDPPRKPRRGDLWCDVAGRTKIVEHLPQVALVAHQLGTARLLGQSQIQRLQTARKQYVETVRQEKLSPYMQQPWRENAA